MRTLLVCLYSVRIDTDFQQGKRCSCFPGEHEERTGPLIPRESMFGDYNDALDADMHQYGTDPVGGLPHYSAEGNGEDNEFGYEPNGR